METQKQLPNKFVFICDSESKSQLERFGFELRAPDIVCYEFHGLEIWFYANCWGLRKRIDNNNSLFLCKVEFVHSLQNLFYALTNQELELK